jgi:hypothetical protein
LCLEQNKNLHFYPFPKPFVKIVSFFDERNLIS